jgi:predicted nucleic acid-binding protein
VILLDTNVIAELMKPQPEPAVLAWADGLDPAAVGITTMNEAEIYMLSCSACCANTAVAVTSAT